MPSGAGEGRASYTFDQIAGVYDLKVAYFDETDGISNYRIEVDGIQVAAFAADDTTGSTRANSRDR